MKKINTAIRDNYKLYKELIYKNKFIEGSPILLHEKISNNKWLTGSTEIAHSKIANNLNLVLEKQLRTVKYGIKLSYKAITNEPIFRFDSDGATHRNRDVKVSLIDQQITTPHFHFFDKDGCSIAYKTDKLKTSKDAEQIQNDIEFGLNHFCYEVNISPNKGEEMPDIRLNNLELFEDEKNILHDPLLGIDFL